MSAQEKVASCVACKVYSLQCMARKGQFCKNGCGQEMFVLARSELAVPADLVSDAEDSKVRTESRERKCRRRLKYTVQINNQVHGSSPNSQNSSSSESSSDSDDDGVSPLEDVRTGIRSGLWWIGAGHLAEGAKQVGNSNGQYKM